MPRRFNNPIVNVIFSSFKPLDGLLDEERTGIKWISQADRDLKTMVEEIIDSVRDQSCPKHIIVSSLQKFVGGSNINTIKAYVREIVEEVKAQRYNKLVFSTAWFIPNHERIWNVTSVFNKEVQMANESMGLARVNGHKAVMVPIGPFNKRRRIRGSQYLEWQMGLGLGNTLSYEGQKCIIRYFQTVLDCTFSARGEKIPSEPAKLSAPPSLGVTTGYDDDLFMKQLLAAKMIIPSRPADEVIMPYSNKQVGNMDWKIYQIQGEMRRVVQRQGVLEGTIRIMKQGDALPVWADLAVDTADDENAMVVDQDEGNDDEVIIIEEIPQAGNIVNDNEAVREVTEDDWVAVLNNDDQANVGQPERKSEKDCNEEIIELTRKVKIAEERSMAYKEANEVNEAKLVRERASVKFWKNTAKNASDCGAIERKKMTEQIRVLEFEHEHTKESLKRMTAEYEFLRDIYNSAERKRPQRLRITRSFVEDKDFDDYGKNHK